MWSIQRSNLNNPNANIKINIVIDLYFFFTNDLIKLITNRLMLISFYTKKKNKSVNGYYEYQSLAFFTMVWLLGRVVENVKQLFESIICVCAKMYGNANWKPRAKSLMWKQKIKRKHRNFYQLLFFDYKVSIAINLHLIYSCAIACNSKNQKRLI